MIYLKKAGYNKNIIMNIPKMSYSENFKSLFDSYYTKLKDKKHICLPVMKFNGVNIRIVVKGEFLLQDNESIYKYKPIVTIDDYKKDPTKHKELNCCIYKFKIAGELCDTEIQKWGEHLYDAESYKEVYNSISNFDVDIPFKQVVKSSHPDIFDKLPRLKDFINESLDNLAVELPTLEFDSYHFQLYSNNEDDDIKKKLDYQKEHELFWIKLKEPDYESQCCICGEDSRFRTECNHKLCLGCHFKIKVEDRDCVDDPDIRKCPMCRNEYSDINWTEEN